MRKPTNAGLEFKSVEAIEKDQAGRLRGLLKYVSQKSPFYKRALAKKGITYSDIKSIKDIQKLPITTKAQLQKHNRDFFAVDGCDMAEIVSTTGTTGEPVFIAMTKGDLDRLALNEARSFYCAGANNKDIFDIAVTLDSLFMAGMAYYLGIVKLGALAFRVGMHNIKKHIQLMRKLKPTGIVTVPTFLLKLADEIKEEGLDPKAVSIKKALLVGESIRDRDFNLNRLGSLITTSWPIELYSTYGNSEGAISFCECQEHIGCHEHPDLIISEILDEKGHVVPDGEPGELVLTTLQIKGTPLLRYQTGDITFKITGKCKCGRNSSRIGPILGRKAQMLKLKGVKMYPKIIENAILNIDGVINYVIEALTGNDFSDKIIVKIGCKRKSEKFRKEVCERIKAYAKVTPLVELASVNEVEHLKTDGGTRRKPRIFIDKRERTQNLKGPLYDRQD